MEKAKRENQPIVALNVSLDCAETDQCSFNLTKTNIWSTLKKQFLERLLMLHKERRLELTLTPSDICMILAWTHAQQMFQLEPLEEPPPPMLVFTSAVLLLELQPGSGLCGGRLAGSIWLIAATWQWAALINGHPELFSLLWARPPLQNQRATTRGNSRECDLSAGCRSAACTSSCCCKR